MAKHKGGTLNSHRKLIKSPTSPHHQPGDVGC